MKRKSNGETGKATVGTTVAPRFTDAFGTRLDPEFIAKHLSEFGLDIRSIVFKDNGVDVVYCGPAELSSAVAVASTWLVSQLSPLLPCRFIRRESSAPGTDSPMSVDERRSPPKCVALAEVFPPEFDFQEAIESLLVRLGPHPTSDNEPTSITKPVLEDPELDCLATSFAQAMNSYSVTHHAGRPGYVTFSCLLKTRNGIKILGDFHDKNVNERDSGTHFLLMRRPGGATAVRPAAIVAASYSIRSLEGFISELDEFSEETDDSNSIIIDGLAWEIGRRPTIAVQGKSASINCDFPIWVDRERCDSCGLCERLCPSGLLNGNGEAKKDASADKCLRCHDCVEACPQDAMRPVYGDNSATLGKTLRYRKGWLSRLIGEPGPPFPAAFPPSYLNPEPDEDSRTARYILGLSITTMQEHAAVLLKDGEIVGAIEEERLIRKRHYGWQPRGRPGVTIAIDPTIQIEEAFCRRSIRGLLQQAGITIDDIDIIALNGIPARYRRAYSHIDTADSVPLIHSGRLVCIPHHLCHAASAYRVSGADGAAVFTVDGRGDRETAAMFRTDDKGNLIPVFEILSLADNSIGGVYETLTRILGFGAHGQGSLMALASFGEPTFDLEPFLSVQSLEDYNIHENGLCEAFSEYARDYEDEIGDQHENLAASLQKALEDSVEKLIHLAEPEVDSNNLCLAGGVALNCRMNEKLRDSFQPDHIFIQPAAHDAGTALGAAAEALFILTGRKSLAQLSNAGLGPEFSDDEIEKTLARSGLEYRKSTDIAGETAEAISTGKIVCWFQHRMEFGPRALGSRSILADPRTKEIGDRVNEIKDRQPWRPFGPSILAEHVGDWIEGAFDSLFMLFTLPLKKERIGSVPAVAHCDGGTRPQVVHREEYPLYHRMIEGFFKLTGIPMVLNTSFNRRGEPIVCKPDHAVECFIGLGADVMAIGNFMVEKPFRKKKDDLRIAAYDAALSACPGGRRLHLRLTTKCDCDCVHCTARDIRKHPDRPFESALHRLAEGREAGCDELVIMRGEATLRKDLPDIIARSRRMGYRFVQIQTNARSLAKREWREKTLNAGVDAFEVSLFAADEELHDRLTKVQGSFRETLLAIRALAGLRHPVFVSVPTLRHNMARLEKTVHLVEKIGASRIQFNFPRPVEMDDGVILDPLARLSDVSPYVIRASRIARNLGLDVTTEAFPYCHLAPELRNTPDSTEDWRRHRVDDLHLLHESLEDERRAARPEYPPCRKCLFRESCPKTWALYLELFGSNELKTIER